jgi:hypothetical protein
MNNKKPSRGKNDQRPMRVAHNIKLTPENQRYIDKYQDAVDDAGPNATQQKINERMGL